MANFFTGRIADSDKIDLNHVQIKFIMFNMNGSLSTQNIWNKTCLKLITKKRKFRSLSANQVRIIATSDYTRKPSTFSTPKTETSFIRKKREIEEYKRTRNLDNLRVLFEERMDLMHELKQKIISQSNSIFVKNILNEIQYLGAGRVLLHLWEQSQKYTKVQNDDLIDFENRLKFVINEDFLKAMDTANNIYRFKLTEFKQASWRDLQNNIKNYSQKITKDSHQINSRLHRFTQKQLKINFNRTLHEIDSQKSIYSNKRHYIKLKDKANDFLLKQMSGCKILRAQIFTEKFHDIGFQ